MKDGVHGCCSVKCRTERKQLWKDRRKTRKQILKIRKQRLNEFSKEIKSKKFKYDLWFRYVIECDGSIHELQSVKKMDEIKDSVFEKKGFHVFCVRHGDIERLLEIGAMVKRIREKKGIPPVPQQREKRANPAFNSPI